MSNVITFTCPNCGAPIKNRSRCEYCFSVLAFVGMEQAEPRIYSFDGGNTLSGTIMGAIGTSGTVSYFDAQSFSIT